MHYLNISNVCSTDQTEESNRNAIRQIYQKHVITPTTTTYVNIQNVYIMHIVHINTQQSALCTVCSKSISASFKQLLQSKPLMNQEFYIKCLTVISNNITRVISVSKHTCVQTVFCLTCLPFNLPAFKLSIFMKHSVYLQQAFQQNIHNKHLQ